MKIGIVKKFKKLCIMCGVEKKVNKIIEEFSKWKFHQN